MLVTDAATEVAASLAQDKSRVKIRFTTVKCVETLT